MGTSPSPTRSTSPATLTTSFLLFMSTFFLLPFDVAAVNNGLGLTPAMGWNSWCTQGPCMRDYCWDDEVRQIADAMSSNGMAEAGYEYINLDDCWAGYRDGDGNVQPDSWRFPNGMKPVVDYVHSKGLKMGLYTDSGLETCVGDRPGSYGHYQQDANTYASWGIDYVKMDWCNTVVNGTELNPKVIYANMSQALNNTGRKIWFNICEWGYMQPWSWGPLYGNSWRSGPDHHDTWDGGNGVADIIEYNVGLSKYAAPGGWNDMDFLMTGGEGCWWDFYEICPGMTQTEYITEFTMWSLLNSPLLVATDIRGSHFTDFKKSVLLNKEVIALNQDKLGVQGDRLYIWPCVNETTAIACQVWSKPLFDKSYAAVLYNRGENAHPITLNFAKLGWSTNTRVALRDLWAHKDLGVFTVSYTATVPSHGVVALKASLA